MEPPSWLLLLWPGLCIALSLLGAAVPGRAALAREQVLLTVNDEKGGLLGQIRIEPGQEAPKVVEQFCSAHSMAVDTCQSIMDQAVDEQHVAVAVNAKTRWMELGDWRQHTAEMAAGRIHLSSFTNGAQLTHMPSWATTLRHLRDKPVRVLDIGSHDGLTATWFLLYFNGASTVTCVDTWEANQGSAGHSAYQRFLANMAFAGARVTVKSAPTFDILFQLDPETYDVALVNSGYQAPDALTHIILAYNLLKPGGLLLVDDAMGSIMSQPRMSEQERYNNVLSTYPAVKAFKHIYQKRMRILTDGAQLHVQKLK